MKVCRQLNNVYAKLRQSQIGESFIIREIPNGGTKNEPYFVLTKKQSLDLMTGYSMMLRVKVNTRWEELENEKLEATKHEKEKPAFDFSDSAKVLPLA